MDHDHTKCIRTVMSHAVEAAKQHGVRLAGFPLEVLGELSKSHEARGAYDILDSLRQPDRRVQPVQVYRALEKLVELGLVHRVESQNAYLACVNGPDCEASVFLICSECQTVVETHDADIDTSLSRAAKTERFVVRKAHVELVGRCFSCRQNNS
jgi:Fur family transcriptional regulator, zinc uptake regulator